MNPLDRLWSRWLLGGVIVAAAGVLFGLQFYVSNAQLGGTSPAVAFIYDQLLYWSTWGLLFPVLLFLARRIPVEPPHRARSLLLHGAIGIAVAYVHASVYVVLYHLFASLFDGTPFSGESVLEGFFRLNMPMRVVNYYLLVAGIFAVEFYQRYVDRTIAASRLETELATAKVQMLRMQMQPHFLFNTLNAISGLVRSGERSQAVSMIAGLSELLRAALDAGDEHEVPLEREIAFARRYLEIEQVRFSDRLSISVEAEPSVRALHVPNLLLQPLVENAVNHGFARRPGPGHISLAAYRAGTLLKITVVDDGMGFPEGWSFERDAGIGLRNTRDRLRQLYGAAGDLVVRPRAGGGSVAEVTLPISHASAGPA